MSHVSEPIAVSAIELVVLGALSGRKPPTMAELVERVAPFVTEPESRAEKVVTATVAELRGRGLMTIAPRAPRARADRTILTDVGARALRSALGTSRVPTWTQMWRVHLPSLAVGLPSASVAKLKLDELELAVSRGTLGLPPGTTLTAFCDALLIRALELPAGKVTLRRLRAHVLARHARTTTTDDPATLVKRIANATVGLGEAGNTKGGRRGLSRALVRQWAGHPLHAIHPQPVGAGIPVPETTPPIAAVTGTNGHHPPPAALLTAVRETIPRVGATGRFGTEKVFVSALWRNLERERRQSNLSLHDFKRWLIDANRDGWLVLARADLVGAMDAKLVAESEIQDKGATFHFVLDQRRSEQERIHAR